MLTSNKGTQLSDIITFPTLIIKLQVQITCQFAHAPMIPNAKLNMQQQSAPAQKNTACSESDRLKALASSHIDAYHRLYMLFPHAIFLSFNFYKHYKLVQNCRESDDTFIKPACVNKSQQNTHVRFLFPDSISVSVISTENSIANSN
jgi:hypothetical protein